MGFFPKGAVLAGYGEPATLFKQQKKCQRCGYPALYWSKHSAGWRLHHYADLSDGKGARFVLHRCGLTSEGKPSRRYPYPQS